MSNDLALVIEDDEDLALVFSEAVRTAGYQVETVYDGSLAQERLAQIVPHLVVLDLHLPGVTGPDLLDCIRSDDRLKDIRIIVATADHRLSQDMRDKRTMVLLKPLSFSQLSELARRLLKAP